MPPWRCSTPSSRAFTAPDWTGQQDLHPVVAQQLEHGAQVRADVHNHVLHLWCARMCMCMGCVHCLCCWIVGL